MADRLKMTVDEMRHKMSNDEFLRWQMYHAKRAQQMELQAKMARAGGR